MSEAKSIRIPIHDSSLSWADRLYLAAVGRGALLGAIAMFLFLATFRT